MCTKYAISQRRLHSLCYAKKYDNLFSKVVRYAQVPKGDIRQFTGQLRHADKVETISDEIG